MMNNELCINQARHYALKIMHYALKITFLSAVF